MVPFLSTMYLSHTRERTRGRENFSHLNSRVSRELEFCLCTTHKNVHIITKQIVKFKAVCVCVCVCVCKGKGFARGKAIVESQTLRDDETTAVQLYAILRAIG